MSEFKQYRRKQFIELRPVTGYELKYGLTDGISMSPMEKENGHPYFGDMIARNPDNHKEQRLVAEEHFDMFFELI